MVISIVAYKIPTSPKGTINRLVANAEAKIFTALFS